MFIATCSDPNIFPELKGCALIRELHVYGQMIPVENNNVNKVAQHAGFGKRLMKKAEEISLNNGWKKAAVIAGTGARPYYKNKCGYHLEGTYMIKKLTLNNYIRYIYKITVPLGVLIISTYLHVYR